MKTKSVDLKLMVRRHGRRPTATSLAGRFACECGGIGRGDGRRVRSCGMAAATHTRSSLEDRHQRGHPPPVLNQRPSVW